MTPTEAQKVIGMLAAYFPGRLPEETQVAWALEIESQKFSDGIAGAREVGRTAQHPQLRGLLEAIAAAKADRLRREARALERTAIPERAAGLDPGRHERTAAAAREARLLVESLAKKKSMPAPDKTPAPVNARNGHETMTPREAEERMRLLREQGERLLREEQGEAAK